jgi:hypothetical protein
MKQTTTPYVTKQNDVIEKKNRPLIKNVEYILQHMKLNHRF